MHPTTNMLHRLRALGAVLVAAGVVVASAGFFYGMPTANDGLASAQAMYAAQGVTLSYNDHGELIDRGTTQTAASIMSLLENEWQYKVDPASFDPNDPVVNTRDELMFQYATITYHVMHGTVDVVLTAEQVPITYRGVTYDEPGTYEIVVGDYYANFDRTHPIEGQLRGAWSPMAIALLGTLAAGHANQATGELAQATTLAIGGLGALIVLVGAGLVWATHGSPISTRADRKSASHHA